MLDRMDLEVTTEQHDAGRLRLVVGSPSALLPPIGAWYFELAPDPNVDGNFRIGVHTVDVPPMEAKPHELDALLVTHGFEEAGSNAARFVALTKAAWELGPRVGHHLARYAEAEVNLATDQMTVTIPVLHTS